MSEETVSPSSDIFDLIQEDRPTQNQHKERRESERRKAAWVGKGDALEDERDEELDGMPQPGNPDAMTEEDIADIKSMLDQGISKKEVAHITGWSYSSVHKAKNIK